MTQPTSRTRTITWNDPAAIARAAAGRTGLEFLRAIVTGEISQAPISATLDFEITAAEEGRAVFTARPGEQHYNPMGSVHGGLACTLLDSAMGSAVMSTLDAATAYATSQLSVYLTRPITAATGPITADARIVHRGSRSATAQGELRDGAGRLLAHGTTTCTLFPRPTA